MIERIEDKREEIENYLEEALEIVPNTFEDYVKDFKTKAACERYFEKIVEAVVDLAFLVIREYNLKMPEDDEGAFEALANENIIDIKLAKKLKEAKGMRNIIAHKYGKVDDRIVFLVLTEELEKDVNEFLEKMKKLP